MNTRRALAILLSRLPVRTIVHPIGRETAWARASDWLGRSRVLDSGVQGEEPELRGRIDVVVHAAEIRISRIDLPGVGAREAHDVARRRREDLSGEGPAAVQVSSLVRSTATGSSIWLISGASDACAEIDAELTARGLRAERLTPLSLALGALVRLLPPPAEPGLTAVLWIEEEWGHCVVADPDGWRFDRQIPLKLGFDLALGEVPASEVAWQEEEHQFIEHVTVELDRTFNYVERNLALGRVTRICVCGPLRGLESFEHALVANQAREVARLGAGPLRAVGSAHPSEGAALGAGMLGGSASEATLLPLSIAGPRLRVRARRRLKRAAAAACVFGALMLACGVWNVTTISAAVARVRAEAEVWERERAGLAQLSTERERAARVLDARATLSRPEPPWSALLVALGGLIPEKLFVRRLAIAHEAEGWRMQIWLDSEGLQETETAEAVSVLRGRLGTLSLFRVIELEPDRAEDSIEARYHVVAWVAAVDDRQARVD